MSLKGVSPTWWEKCMESIFLIHDTSLSDKGHIISVLEKKSALAVRIEAWQSILDLDSTTHESPGPCNLSVTQLPPIVGHVRRIYRSSLRNRNNCAHRILIGIWRARFTIRARTWLRLDKTVNNLLVWLVKWSDIYSLFGIYNGLQKAQMFIIENLWQLIQYNSVS